MNCSYLLDFLELKDTYREKDLENAIISELEKFILEMGNDFAFLARQKRITIDGEDTPIAIILCATKSDMMAELLELDNSGIHVAQYLTEYVPKEMIERKFLDSIEKAKIQLEQRKKLKDKEGNKILKKY